MWTISITPDTNLGADLPDDDFSSEQPCSDGLLGDDKSLLQRYRRGDDDAATELYLRYAHRLRALASAQTSADLQQRVDSEDLVQSIFRTFFRRVARGQYDVPNGDELWKLLLVIGLNKIRSTAIHHRAAKRDVKKTSSGDTIDVVPTDVEQSDGEGLKILEMTIDDLLTQLPEQYREIVQLRIAGYELSEIAEKTKRSKRTVERILQAFRQKLGELIHDVE